jgi:hypothetical protein
VFSCGIALYPEQVGVDATLSLFIPPPWKISDKRSPLNARDRSLLKRKEKPTRQRMIPGRLFAPAVPSGRIV